jgi:hypothetical protein
VAALRRAARQHGVERDAAGSSWSPRSTARSCSMRSADQRDRLARVQFLVLPASR